MFDLNQRQLAPQDLRLEDQQRRYHALEMKQESSPLVDTLAGEDGESLE